MFGIPSKSTTYQKLNIVGRTQAPSGDVEDVLPLRLLELQEEEREARRQWVTRERWGEEEGECGEHICRLSNDVGRLGSKSC